tara:strand:- start:47 stop:421 length:375 start_codon:yes stop_codon:yes gene_type:complete
MKVKIFVLCILLNAIAFFAEASPNLENEIFKNLRCLICQGQSVAESNSEFAQTIKMVVRDQIDNGKSEEEIYEFLAEKYGEWIVYKPPFNKYNFLLWSLPYLALFVGGFLIFLLLRKKSVNRRI